MLNVIVHVRPFSEPGDGVMYERFADDARYSIHITNPNTGATTFSVLDSYTQPTIYELPSGEVVFAGSREDGFFADTPGIFDLLDPRIVDNDGTLIESGPPRDINLGPDGGGMDDFKGFNVLAFAIQIPVRNLPSIQYNSFFGSETGVGFMLPSVVHVITAATCFGRVVMDDGNHFRPAYVRGCAGAYTWHRSGNLLCKYGQGSGTLQMGETSFGWRGKRPYFQPQISTMDLYSRRR